MGNEEVQPKQKGKQNTRTSVIRKGIKRTLWTAKYEGIVIQDEIEEVIEWNSLQEREKKSRNWNTLLIKSFKQTQQDILEELGLDHVKAFAKKDANKDCLPEPGQAGLDDLDELE